MSEKAFSWQGWFSGESDCEPPEPGKEWLTINLHTEEFAVVVFRDTNLPGAEGRRLQKERDAQFLVDALNAYVLSQIREEWGV